MSPPRFGVHNGRELDNVSSLGGRLVRLQRKH